MNATTVMQRLEEAGDPAIAEHSARFFKSGPGEYGEGDRFRGIRVPVLRSLVREFRDLPHDEVVTLLQSPWHEDRLLALLIWVEQARRGDHARREIICKAYLTQRAQVNNWDLVDSSAEHLLGAVLYARGEIEQVALLSDLATAASLWDRRIAIMATFHFIRKGHFGETLRLADLLLHDRADLIHKAVGWMLREVGNRDQGVLEQFLAGRYATMPRTMLRYAIEKLPEPQRLAYLRGDV